MQNDAVDIMDFKTSQKQVLARSDRPRCLVKMTKISTDEIFGWVMSHKTSESFDGGGKMNDTQWEGRQNKTHKAISNIDKNWKYIRRMDGDRSGTI